ncbi:MAG: hypothetical protein ACK4XK_01180 [Casimicrobiaceae bacterium]
MIESGFWIFIVEAIVAGALFVGLILWVMRGPSKRDRERFEQARAIQSEGRIDPVAQERKPSSPPSEP